ncbi:hypothetical protein F5Y16DRAFT_383737 [Xylariaceae sp. FL0255]|nr:hypothetical protein F5Y16DRAFT_383737 [Xylariaceae sp. FL0255]
MISFFLALLLRSKVSAQTSADCGFIGGYPLRNADSCPSDAPVTCGVGLQPRCCPSGFDCVSDPTTNGTYCCESGQNCVSESESHPQCPESTWNVWAYDSDGSRGWCCEDSFYGFATLANDGVGCQPIGESIDTDEYHTVTQYFTQSITCSSSSSVATTSTSSSSVQTTTPIPTGSGTPTPTPTHSPSAGLSVGGIVGVAIGAAALIVLIAVAGWYCMSRRRNKSPGASPVELAGATSKLDPNQHGPSSAYPSSYAPTYETYEAPSDSIVRHEMPAYTDRPNEAKGYYHP